MVFGAQALTVEVGVVGVLEDTGDTESTVVMKFDDGHAGKAQIELGTELVIRNAQNSRQKGLSEALVGKKGNSLIIGCLGDIVALLSVVAVAERKEEIIRFALHSCHALGKFRAVEGGVSVPFIS